MKKITFCVMAIFLSLTFYPLQSDATPAKKAVTTTLVATNPVQTDETKALLKRIDEIDKMDKSDLKSSEKKALRKEVRTIKKQLEETDGYIYISVGAVVLIVLLIVILL